MEHFAAIGAQSLNISRTWHHPLVRWFNRFQDVSSEDQDLWFLFWGDQTKDRGVGQRRMYGPNEALMRILEKVVRVNFEGSTQRGRFWPVLIQEGIEALAKAIPRCVGKWMGEIGCDDDLMGLWKLYVSH